MREPTYKKKQTHHTYHLPCGLMLTVTERVQPADQKPPVGLEVFVRDPKISYQIAQRDEDSIFRSDGLVDLLNLIDDLRALAREHHAAEPMDNDVLDRLWPKYGVEIGKEAELRRIIESMKTVLLRTVSAIQEQDEHDGLVNVLLAAGKECRDAAAGIFPNIQP